MNVTFRLRTLTIITFCLYIFWGAFGVDITLNPGADRMPLHRILLLSTAFIFLFNTRQVLVACFNNKLLIALLLYVLLTSGWVNTPSETIKNFVFLSSALFISMMTALAFVDNRMTLIRSMFWLFLAMVVSSIIAALFFPKIGINTVDFGKPRWIGITTHPNVLGALALVLIWLSSNLFFLSKIKLEKIIIVFAAIAAFYLIIKADSMTSLITSLVVMGYTFYYYLFGRISLPIKLVMLVICFISVLFVAVFFMGPDEFATAVLKSTGRNMTFTGRSLLWQKALEAVNENMMFGYGFDNLEQLTKKYHILMSHLHNGYVEILVKGGVIGAVLLAFILIKTLIEQLRIDLKYRHYFIFLNTGFIMIMLHNFTESSILKGLNTLSILFVFIVVFTSQVVNSGKMQTAKSIDL